jgi:integral membrane sensor domain MASE1
MAILLPRKPTLICLVVLGPICVVDGIVKKNNQEILAMLAVFIYAVVTLIMDSRKKKKLINKNNRQI